jgi:hypothetical protein
MNATNVERIKTLEEEVKRQGEEIAHLKSFTDSLFIRIVTHEMESRKPEQAKSPARISPSADSRYTERELVAAGEIEKIQPLDY